MSTAREDTVRLVQLLEREHHALAEFLIALAAFDHERRWVDLGYASLFAFLTRELRLSAGAAQYRKTAAELIRRYPEIAPALRRGDLCLTSVIELSKVISPENAADVLPRFFGKSARDAAFVAASIRPVENPPARDFLVTPVRVPGEVPRAVSGGVFRAPEVDSVAAAPPPPTPIPDDRPKVRPLDAEHVRLNMTVSREFLDLLGQARDALSHSHPGAPEETIIKVGLHLIVDRHRKRRGIGAKPRKPVPPVGEASAAPSPAEAPPPPRGRSRHVPAAVWRAVWARDGGTCAYPLENGGVCGSTTRLELDHVRGFALGAGTTPEECRLCCDFHNDLHAHDLYGDDRMSAFTRPKRGPRCSEAGAAYGGPSALAAAATVRGELEADEPAGRPPLRAPHGARCHRAFRTGLLAPRLASAN